MRTSTRWRFGAHTLNRTPSGQHSAPRANRQWLVGGRGIRRFASSTGLCRLDSRLEFAYLLGVLSRLDGLFQQGAKRFWSSRPSPFLAALSYLFLHANQKEGQDSRFLGLQLRERFRHFLPDAAA